MTAPASHQGRRHWGYALLAAAVAAWATFFGLSWLIAATVKVSAAHDSAAQSGQADLVVLAAVFGIPVTLVVCFAVGVLALAIVEVLKLSKWWQLALTGAVSGLTVSGLIVVLAMPATGASPLSVSLEGILAMSVSVAVLTLTGAAAGIAAWASLMLDDHASNRHRKVI